ncbi:MAG: stage II sporulation protein M [Candidatus Diapherotrites archaeon]
MVLEAIFDSITVKRHPWFVFFTALIASSIAIWLSYYTFPETSSILALAFITIAFVPLIHSMFVEEEEKEIHMKGSSFGFLFRHKSLISVYAWIFLGIMFSYVFWFAVLPAAQPDYCISGNSIECMLPTKDKVFMEQSKTMTAISGKAVLHGKAVGVNECKNPETKNMWACTELIFMNNSLVMGLAILFSFIWGAGAIFLIGWNASVIGSFIGFEAISSHSTAVARFLSYLPHGTFEVMGYFIGAIAGGIISIAITKKKYGKHEFSLIARDALTLIVIAYWVLLIGAVVEAWLLVMS